MLYYSYLFLSDIEALFINEQKTSVQYSCHTRSPSKHACLFPTIEREVYTDL